MPSQASHAGEYECNAYRNAEVIASSKVELHVEGDTHPDLLHVDISPPLVRVVNKGDSIVLDCVVHGWFRRKSRMTVVSGPEGSDFPFGGP